jgi:hypothetical protein
VTPTSSDIITQKALSAHSALTQALAWVVNSKESEVAGNTRLLKNLRTSVYQSRYLAAAAKAKMCVGVYGPSQSGKSYLVSALARKPGERLVAVVGEKDVDFIELINPEGGKESTGLVTRFTSDAISAPSGFPIQLKILSELDLIKLFVNSYALDILPDEDDELQKHQDQVQRVLNELETMPRGSSPLSVEDVYDLEDYCKGFSSNLRIQALKKMDFWERAAELLPFLGESGRLRLVQVLWEELPSYSHIYANLIAELGRMGHDSQVYCSPNALFKINDGHFARSETSIINVATLDLMGVQASLQVDVKLSAGATVSISVHNLCALTSELVIPMRNKPHDMFARADLLDFPGARSRKGHPKKDQSLNQPAVRVDNFLRGKVAYLFDKYSASLELTSMVLCLGPSNQEVVGLDAMIEDWIIKTHGGKPEEREKLKTALFVVLSKFDMEFSEGAGKSLDGSRWTTRLQASLLNSFGSHAHKTNWVKKWTSQSAFNNVFWLRNPNADQSGLIDYEGIPGSSKETGYASKKLSVINTLQEAFIANPLVQQHFVDPLIAWNAGMALNDGGAKYLMEKLDEACTNDLKLKQIDERIQTIIRERHADLSKYFTSSDLEGLEREKLQLAKNLTASLAKQMTKQRLGEFIHALLESDIDTVDTFKLTLLDFERAKHSKHKKDPSDTSSSSISIDPRLAEELGLDVPISSIETTEVKLSPHLSFPEVFIQRFLDDWRSRCMNRFSAVNLSDYLITESELMPRLLNELELAARRTGLIQQLIDQVKINYQYKTDDRRSWIWRQTATVTARFNDFLTHGGHIKTERHPIKVLTLQGKDRDVFTDSPSDLQTVTVPEMQTDFSERYLLDWIQALQHSIRSNSVFQAGIKSDATQNRQLGIILEQLNVLVSTETHSHAP